MWIPSWNGEKRREFINDAWHLFEKWWRPYSLTLAPLKWWRPFCFSKGKRLPNAIRHEKYIYVKANSILSRKIWIEVKRCCVKSSVLNQFTPFQIINFLILSILAPTFFWILYNKCTIINWLSLPINSFGTSALANSLTSVSHCCKLVKDFLLVTS